MGFSGGGGGALPAHVHNNIPLQGGPLDFVNSTVGSLSAGSVVYSDGAAFQELVKPAVPAGEVLSYPALAVAPSWLAGGTTTETCYLPVSLTERGLRNNYPLYGVEITDGSSPVFGKTISDVSFFLRINGTPSGDGYVYIYDSSGSLQATSNSPINWSALTSSWTKYTFTISHTVAVGDRIVIGGGTTGIGQEVSFYGDESATNTSFQSLCEFNSSTSTWSLMNSGNSGAKWCFTS